MNTGKTLLAQVMEFIVLWISFHRIVRRYYGNAGVRTLLCAEQFRAMAFAQFAGAALRDHAEVSVGSRVMADLIASTYNELQLPKHAKGRLLDLGGGKVPLSRCFSGSIRPWRTQTISTLWPSIR